jgi:hypothetical protein
VICALLFPLSFARQRMCKGEHLSSFAASFFLRTLVKSFVVVFRSVRDYAHVYNNTKGVAGLHENC